METKDLWKRMKKVNGQNYDKLIIQLSEESGDVVEDPKKIANMLAEYYSGVSNFQFQ